jgi:hypothetical protein
MWSRSMRRSSAAFQQALAEPATSSNDGRARDRRQFIAIPQPQDKKLTGEFCVSARIRYQDPSGSPFGDISRPAARVLPDNYNVRVIWAIAYFAGIIWDRFGEYAFQTGRTIKYCTPYRVVVNDPNGPGFS